MVSMVAEDWSVASVEQTELGRGALDEQQDLKLNLSTQKVCRQYPDLSRLKTKQPAAKKIKLSLASQKRG